MNANFEGLESNGSGAMTAFVAGAAIGVLAALILAPSSGRDTRAYLKRRSNELGREAFERGREVVREQSERVSAAVQQGWDRAGSAISHAREEGQEAYRSAKRTSEESQPAGTIRPGFQG